MANGDFGQAGVPPCYAQIVHQRTEDVVAYLHVPLPSHANDLLRFNDSTTIKCDCDCSVKIGDGSMAEQITYRRNVYIPARSPYNPACSSQTLLRRLIPHPMRWCSRRPPSGPRSLFGRNARRSQAPPPCKNAMSLFVWKYIALSAKPHLAGRGRTAMLVLIGTACLLTASAANGGDEFPGDRWVERSPADCGVDAAKLIEVSTMLGGRGCVIKDGYVVHEWGDQAKRGDWMSSAKPVLSTLLFFALQEGRIESVDQRVSDFEERVAGKDREITFRQLGGMASGFRRPEQPGAAWAYNDPAIQLYQLTLFDHVFQADPDDVAGHADRLGALKFEDGLKWSKDKRRLRASPRDFARIAWFWLNKGAWRDEQLLPASYFDEFARPQTPKDLAATQGPEGEDYLEIGSFGGGSDHFTQFGAGIYGFNWWFNDTGRLHPDSITWPGSPPDTFMSIGAGGNCAAMFPSSNMVLVCAEGDWGKLDAGNAKSRMNRILALASSAVEADSSAARVNGELTKWRPVTIDFHGPSHKASDSDPNPFLDYRLQMRFTGPTGAVIESPGFFAGNGAGGLSGDVWRVIFSPDAVGDWGFEASFREGKNIAVDDDPNAGSAAAFNGASGRFEIQERPPSAQGFYRFGRLEYVGEHYFKLRDGPYWLKGGTDSPEDFLAYHGFINTPKARHHFANHVDDWNEGDPDWNDGQGKGIIGALNYLAAQNVNSIYLLPMNLGGDGKNVYPFLGKMQSKGSSENDNLHYDITKLRQWSTVFEHAQRKGILIHIVLNEAEEPNKRELDDGLLGVERKLFYRELVARFGHFPAIQWNLCEEYNLHHKFDPALVKEFAKYIAETDPYDHPITVHHAGRAEQAWAPFLGDPNFAATSFQERKEASKIVEDWREVASCRPAARHRHG